MIVAGIILFISLFLESVLPNLIREFIPFFMIGTIVIISTFNADDNKMCMMAFVSGILYDLLYTDLIIFHGFIYLGVLLLSKLILKKSNNFFLMIFTYYLLVITYSIVMYLFTFFISNVDFIKVFSLILKSLFINSLVFIFYYIIFIGTKCLIRNRGKKHSY